MRGGYIGSIVLLEVVECVLMSMVNVENSLEVSRV